MTDRNGAHSLSDDTAITGRRSWERLEYQTSMVLVMDDGQRFEGKTTDVSLSGVLLVTPIPPKGVKLGDKGKLHIVPAEEELIFSCQVMRATPEGIGLNFHDNNATFGMYITHGMMLDLLSSINNSFSASLDLNTTLETSVSHIKNYLQSEAASLFLVDEDNNDIVCRACSGPIDITGTRLEINEGIVGRVIHRGEAVIVNDVKKDSFFSNKVDEITGFKTESLLCAPLQIKGKSIGALEIINKRGSGFFAGHDRIVLTALASAAAMAIHNARQSVALVEKDAIEKASHAKSDFLSSMSHELRTPMNAILGFSEMLLLEPNSSLAQNHRETVEQIFNSGGHLLNLINEILDLAQIESGKLSISISEVAPQEILEECFAMNQPLAKKNNVTLKDETANVQLPTIWSDPLRFRQIIINLLSNAVKYNHKDGDVTVSVERTSDGMLRFMVADTGRGIAKEEECLIFEPFTRLGIEGSAQEGTGIGLTITHRLVEMMNGRIGFESTIGKGTTFWVDMPIADETSLS
ncbi:MAG: GAF domain-containing protein [Rhodospirillaceae bacterium]|nr:GAF domain-containing protein [Rhodospirillaceae bacterium]